jgi:hypothetical protein
MIQSSLTLIESRTNKQTNMKIDQNIFFSETNRQGMRTIETW